VAGTPEDAAVPPLRVLVVGQGYVGLPLALRAVEVGDDVTAYDVDTKRVDVLRAGRSHVSDVADGEVERALASGRYRPVAVPTELGALDVAVITVPTPLTDGVPDLAPIREAADVLGPLVRPGCTVVLESTTYPGTTEELLAPALEAASGLKAGVDFHVGYSPERIDPGNPEWSLVSTPKVVAGLTPSSLAAVEAFYGRLVERTVAVSTTRVAELTKLLENTFRHVNIALPIVATRVGGVAEQLGNGAALLVPPRDPSALADALGAVLSDPRRRAELSAAARSLAPRFDVNRAMSALTARYEQLAGPVVTPHRHPLPPSPRRGASPEVRRATSDDREQILALLRASLGWQDDDRWRELFAWKHERNPFGPSLGWVVEHEGQVVAVRLFMRWAFCRGGTTLPAVRAVDTATHPDHQHRGLFSALTRHALEACRGEGVAFVFNTPNNASRPGYLKLGWREVGRPATAVRPASGRNILRVTRSRVPAEHWSIPLDCGADIASWLDRDGTWPGPPTVSSTDRTLRTASDERYARWRYGPAALHYRVVDDGREAIVVRLRRRGAGRELVVAEQLGDPDRADRLIVDTLRAVDATHAVRLGGENLRRGFVRIPGGGPLLTWRGVCDQGPPPLSNWDLRLGDLELF
jgi:GNAT superfamily N-acetyltransferase